MLKENGSGTGIFKSICKRTETGYVFLQTFSLTKDIKVSFIYWCVKGLDFGRPQNNEIMLQENTFWELKFV